MGKRVFVSPLAAQLTLLLSSGHSPLLRPAELVSKHHLTFQSHFFYVASGKICHNL